MTNTYQVRWPAIIGGAIGVVAAFHMIWRISIPFYLIVAIITVVLGELNILQLAYIEAVAISLMLSVLGWGIAFYRREKSRLRK